ncbi:MAG: GNAT family N-acetyltransferase [FCB group bacterium]|nr:GNAT family N-acetyltransferase [FCB group bacterium]
MSSADVIIRPISDKDSIEELTELLHRSYKVLADMGLKYLATWQDSDITRKRIAKGECFVAEDNGRIIGTINLYPPDILGGSPWLERGDIAEFGQFAVDPEFQKQGIGEMMVEFVENRARQIGLAEIGLNTSEKSDHLIKWYEKLGYRFIEYVDWDLTNYRSVIMSKTL